MRKALIVVVAHARALADLEALRPQEGTRGLAATDGPLLRRVQRLLGVSDARRQPLGSTWAPAVLVLALLCAVIAGERVLNAFPGAVQNPTSTLAAGVPNDEGVLQGYVVDAQSGRPLSGVRITLMLNDDGRVSSTGRAPGAREGVTDRSGRFEIREVVPASYSVSANADGYLSTRFGQAGAGPMGMRVEVASGRRVSGVDFELIRAGVVSGRVFSDLGDGVVGVEVELLREVYLSGQMTPVAVAFDQTEEFGAFQFRDIAPGEYFVRAYAPASVRPEKAEASETYAVTYFPAATQIGSAQQVYLSPGQELFGVDFALAIVQTFILRGRLVDPTGSPLTGVAISTPFANTGNLPDQRRFPVARDGRFEIPGMPAGDYVLMIRDPHRGTNRRWPMQQVSVVDDMTEVLIVSQVPARVSGRFAIDDRSPVPFDVSALRLRLQTDIAGTRRGRISSGAGVIRPDGTLEAEITPGSTSVQVLDLPSGWAVDVVRADGVELRDDVLDVFPGGRSDLEIVLTDRVGSVSGVVTDSSNDPVSRVLVVLFPNDPSRWGAERLTKTTLAQPDGSYWFEDLTLGEYRIVAVASLPRDAWRNPDVLEQLWTSATRVELLEEEQRAVSLELSPIPPGLGGQ